MITRKAPTDKFCHPRVARLMEIGYFDQRSDGWFAERRQRLTASDVDAVLGSTPRRSKNSVFKTKTSPPRHRGQSHYALHGIRFEEEAVRKFESVYEKEVIDFGLIPHPELNWLGASPDGICLTGEMLEVKCPVTREILPAEKYPLGCPDQYYGQVQTQLWCANLDKCYFVQYKPGNFFCEEEFLVTIVKRSQEWYDESIPILKQFWDEVIEFRKTYPDWETVNHHKTTFNGIVDLEEKKELSMPYIDLFKSYA